MTDAERIIELEREIAETQAAAVKIIVGMALGMVNSPEGRLEVAEGFANAAVEPDSPIAKLSRLAANAIRRTVNDGMPNA